MAFLISSKFDQLRANVTAIIPPMFVFTHLKQQSIEGADIIFIAVGMESRTTPASKKGEPEWTKWANTWKHLVHQVPGIMNKIIVDMTTLPLDFEMLLQRAISPNILSDYRIVLNPSFMSEGSAVNDIQNPSQILIGSTNPLYSYPIIGLYNGWVNQNLINYVPDFDSAILSKLAINLILSVKVATANALNNLTINLPEDIMDRVSRTITLDWRIANDYLGYGVGFGGTGFEKCLNYLSDGAKRQQLVNESVFFKQIIKVNESTKRCFVKKMKFHMGGTKGKIIAILGFTYKPGTNSYVNSPAINICLELVKEEGATVRIHDPTMVDGNINYLPRINEFAKYQPRIQIPQTANLACHGADAVCILTACNEFLFLDFVHIFNFMRDPDANKTIFLVPEMMNIAPELRLIGFRVFSL